MTEQTKDDTTAADKDAVKEDVKEVEKEIATKEATAKKSAVKANAKAERTIKELLYVDEYLEAHGLTISDLLRTVAKNFHGISIPLYKED